MATKAKTQNHWVINKDYEPTEGAVPGTNGNAVGMKSRGCPDWMLTRPDLLPFRMLDDDGRVYYEGVMVPFDEHDDNSYGFEPLDDFGGPNAGCTSLEYLDPETDCWELL